MFDNTTPKGCAYLQTFQAIFQIAELVVGLVSWALLASQHFFTSPGLSFSFGALLFVWLLTLFFFLMYVTGMNITINNNCVRLSGYQTSSRRRPCSCCSDSPWFVMEYWFYIIMDVLLIVAMALLSVFHVHNAKYIASAVLGWFAVIIYLTHTLLLIRNTEGFWPHEAIKEACNWKEEEEGTADEEQRLLFQEVEEPQP